VIVTHAPEVASLADAEMRMRDGIVVAQELAQA